MKIIGVTGGIGSGKSTVSKILERLGAKIIDADGIALEITAPGSKVLDEIIQYFGGEILSPQGQLDRKKLAQVVFNQPEKLKALNRMTHPPIMKKIKHWVSEEKIKGEASLLVIEASIPLQNGYQDMVDQIWVVTADMEVRVQRVKQRSGLSRDEILKRVYSQMSESEYKAIGDVVISNSGTLENLQQEIEKLIGEWN